MSGSDERVGKMVVVNEGWDKLASLHPGNPLFRRREPPGEGKLYVYHITSQDNLEAIASSGLRPKPIAEMSLARQRLEAIFAASAPAGRTRSTSLFAYPDLEQRCLAHHWTAVQNGFMRGLVVLAVEVDPSRAIVADTLRWNEAARLLLVEMVEVGLEAQARYYWDSLVSLSDYLALDAGARQRLVGMPEVVIPLQKGEEIDTRAVRVWGRLEALEEMQVCSPRP